MTIDDKVKALSTVGLLAGWSKRELRTAARLCSEKRVEEGFVLTTQGAPGWDCFMIAAGEATVAIDGRVVAAVGPGDHVGEISLIDGRRRTATVVAVTPMTLYVMPGVDFRLLLNTSPGFAVKVLTSLVGRLRDTETGSQL